MRTPVLVVLLKNLVCATLSPFLVVMGMDFLLFKAEVCKEPSVQEVVPLG